ncbi:transposase [Candidatus Woesebacteria bacterium]|nr:transposase [Candidatus Woesebacteria bacterium]
MKNKPKCPNCSNQKTRKRGTRRGKNRYQCQECRHWFQINRSAEKIPSKKLLVQHLSGIPFRGLAEINNCSVGTAYNRVEKGLKELPLCIDVTRWYCEKFQGILLVDGKYVRVKKYDRKIPVIYGVDYKTHDIPHFRLTKSEDYLNCKKFFESLKLTDYGLQAIVCDDNQNIYNAAKYVFPNVVIQLCHVHFLRNTKALLDMENNKYHQIFFPVLTKLLIEKRSKNDFEKKAANLVRQFSKDEVCSDILIELARKQSLLQGYLHHKGTPTTTNLIESMNSHLEARLRPLKGFESFKHAELWLNGYFLRRRTKKFTDCSGKFRRLNGKTSLEITKKMGIDLPIFF